MPLVLVEMIDAGLRSFSTLLQSERLISRFSVTASMIQSQSATFGRSLSKLPVEIIAAEESTKNAPGRCLMAVSTPFLAASSVTSRRMEGIPALAKWAAIREPMVPAPRTATRRIVGIVHRAVYQLNSVQCFGAVWFCRPNANLIGKAPHESHRQRFPTCRAGKRSKAGRLQIGR